MFKDIYCTKFLERDESGHRNSNEYEIHDDNFIKKITVKYFDNGLDPYYPPYYRSIAVIMCYPYPESIYNLFTYLNSLQMTGEELPNLLLDIKNYCNKYYPEIEFGTKFYQQILDLIIFS